MSTTEEQQEQVRARIRTVTAEDSDERERLLEAVDEVPFTQLTDIQTETNQVIGSRGFERRLRDDFERVGNRASPLSTWLSGHLDLVDEDYPYRMWKRYVFFIRREIPAYGAPDYDDLRTHLWKLNELDLIETTRREATDVEGRIERQFYALTPGSLERTEWSDPTDALYG